MTTIRDMMIAQAKEQLKTIDHQWIDFGYWSSLQLHLRGFEGTEDFSKKMKFAEELHELREIELKVFHARMAYTAHRMWQEGAANEEVNAFYRSHDKKLGRLVTAWRSLD
jgi:hypothetical protein